MCRYMDNVYVLINNGDRNESRILQEMLTKLYNVPIQCEGVFTSEASFLEVKMVKFNGKWATRLNCKYVDMCMLANREVTFPLKPIGLPSGSSLTVDQRSVLMNMFIKSLRYSSDWKQFVVGTTI